MIYTRRPIIGLAGNIGSGKTTAAKELCRLGFERFRFAGPLKDMCRALGMTDEQVDGALKEEPCDLLCGKTPRHAMQTLGTEWGRELIGEELWINAWRHAISKTESPIVTDDLRFPNEASAVRAVGGIVVLVTRPGNAVQTHTSEKLDFDADLTIVNDRSLDKFLSKVNIFGIRYMNQQEDAA
ncbi:MAG: deoxynucleotide monophosphate kinase family protein [Ktedonobacterales bacterium]